jgi:N-acetylmuramoyl-L-alanine amidase
MLFSRQRNTFQVLMVGAMALLAQSGWGATMSRSANMESVAVRLESRQQSKPLILSARLDQGVLMIPLKAAVSYLGGKTTWHGTTRKVVVKGSSGRQAVIAMDVPKIVVDRKILVRLPHLPRLIRGHVVVSPESLTVIWKAIGNRIPTYDAKQHVFRVGQVQKVKKAAEQINPPPKKNGKAKELVVVVDAGHGGKDPGAVGPTGLKEKVVTLEVATQLAKLLKKRGIKVIMTRKTDVYIKLQDRAGKANKAKADLFVSVHANASRNRKANGSQVFIYNREASSKQAAEVARLENQDSNYLEIIKDDLRQSVHEESSITAGGLISQQFTKLKLNVKRIERAPFYVLAKSHMPSILVETAFISNHAEERKLRSRKFCLKLAEGIEHGIRLYRQEKKQAAK